MMARMIDSHCHLADPKFTDDLPLVLKRAEEAGVERMITIADSMPESEKCLELAKKYDQIFCTVGVHPHNAKDWKPADVQTLESLVASSKKVRAIGEIGLDYHYDFSSPEQQGPVFASQVALAHRLHLPMVIHCREAVEDIWAVVREYADIKLVIHCCTEKWEDVERFVDNGWLLSFTGIATFPASTDIRETIAQCPLNQMMIETDSPYLAPIPYRGKRNEPAYVTEVAKCIAQIKKLSMKEVDEATTKNAVEFFSLP